MLVGEAYQLLDAPAQQVLQALSVLPTPVPAVGVDFLLRLVNPTTDAAPILTRLVRRQLVRFQDRHYHLHPIDQEYARNQLPAGSLGDSPTAFTLTGLQARAADYYAQIRTPQESWRTLEDVRPQLAEFELRCGTGEFEIAAAVLDDIDSDYLRVWGHYRTLVGLHGCIHGRIINSKLNAAHLVNLGNCHASMGEYRQAIDLYTQALAIARDIGDRHAEAVVLGNQGNCHYELGEYRQAIDLYTQALAIARDIGDRHAEAAVLGNQGNCHHGMGGYRQAIDLLTQSLAIARDIGDRRTEAAVLGEPGELPPRSWASTRQAIDAGRSHARSLATRVAGATSRRHGAATAAPGTVLGHQGNYHYDVGERPAGHRPVHPGAGHRPPYRRPPHRGRRAGRLGDTRHRILGEYRQAIDLLTQAQAIARDIDDRRTEGTVLGDWGNCHHGIGEYRQAIDLYTQALAIARDIGDRRTEAAELGNLGNCHASIRRAPAGHRPVHPGARPSPAVSATAAPRPPCWAIGGTATASWASTGRPSTCSPRRWPSPATSATAAPRPMHLIILARHGWHQATRMRR